MKSTCLNALGRTIRSAWNLIYEIFTEWDRDNAMQLSAVVAFYTIFSFAPLLVILMAIASSFFGRDVVRSEVLSQLQGILSPSGSKTVHTILQNARPTSTMATLLGIAGMLFGATAVFVALQDALNRIFRAKIETVSLVKRFLKKRLMSFVMLLAVGILLLGATVFSTAVSFAGRYLEDIFPKIHLIDYIQLSVSLVLAALLFGTVYKVLPDVKIDWTDIWIGSFVTSILFNLGKTLIGLYLSRSTLGSLYGAAGSFAVFLVWIYYSAMVFFIGAEFTKVCSRRRNPSNNLKSKSGHA